MKSAKIAAERLEAATQSSYLLRFMKIPLQVSLYISNRM